MPVKRVAMADLERAVDDIERTGRLIGLTMAGSGCVLIAYEPKRRQAGAKETR